MTIEQQIQEATAVFVDGLAEALRNHMHELIDDALGDVSSGGFVPPASRGRTGAAATGPSGVRQQPAKKTASSGRLARRSPEQIGEAVAQVAVALRQSGKGLRSEQIREACGLSSKEMPRIIKQGLADGAFKVLSGQKRSTTYGVKGGKAVSAKTAPVKKAKKAKVTKATAKKAPAKKVKKAKRAKAKKAAAPPAAEAAE